MNTQVVVVELYGVRAFATEDFGKFLQLSGIAVFGDTEVDCVHALPVGTFVPLEIEMNTDVPVVHRGLVARARGVLRR